MESSSMTKSADGTHEASCDKNVYINCQTNNVDADEEGWITTTSKKSYKGRRSKDKYGKIK